MTRPPHLRLVGPGEQPPVAPGAEPALVRCSRCYLPIPVVGASPRGSLLAAPGHICPWDDLRRRQGRELAVTIALLVGIAVATGIALRLLT